MLLSYLTNFIKIIEHKWFVLIAGLKVGSIPIHRLLLHDMSKFSFSEFGPYARKFYPYSPSQKVLTPTKIEEEFSLAWLHHERNNPHHWGYWVPGSGKMVGKPLPMPRSYARELVADLMGAGRAYSKDNSWDINHWVIKNVPTFNLHKASKAYILEALRDAGYIPACKHLHSVWHDELYAFYKDQ